MRTGQTPSILLPFEKTLPSNDFFKLGKNLTKRQISLQKTGHCFGLGITVQNLRQTPKNLSVLIISKQKWSTINTTNLSLKTINFIWFDLSYTEGAFIAKEDIKASFLLVELGYSIPKFILDRENFLGGLNEITPYDDIDFSEFTDFSRRFFFRGRRR